jgi:uncharacterized protein (DUF433 family)
MAMKKSKFITKNPEIMGGEPVFTGTRVPVRSMFEHLQSGCTLSQFLRWFPTVPPESAKHVLSEAEASLLNEKRK